MQVIPASLIDLDGDDDDDELSFVLRCGRLSALSRAHLPSLGFRSCSLLLSLADFVPPDLRPLLTIGFPGRAAPHFHPSTGAERLLNMKRELSPAPLPPSKRAHTSSEPSLNVHKPQLAFDTLLFDEIILLILSHLSWTDLCAMQATNRNFFRLSLDNQVYT